jgi:hypothetical protein
LHPKNKKIIKNLALEAETAINHLPDTDREFYRWQTARQINVLYKQNQHTSDHKGKSETKTLKNIKKKLNDNSAMIT